ncbi:MAG: lipid A biosynthesis acyltransferase [Fretibacterium sp.]|nr:lipid A biosynthesis acyltransferase [Fretibacterium sp.]
MKALLERVLLRFLVEIARLLPHRVALAFGAFLGRLLWAFSRRRVDRAEARCVSVLGIGVTRARKVIRDSYLNLGRSAIEFVCMNQLKPRLNELITIEGLENLKEAHARGLGVLAIVAHQGSWELAGARLVNEAYSFVPIATPQRNRGGWDDFVQTQRRDVAGYSDIALSRGMGPREVVKALKRGDVVLILQDLDAREDGVVVPFLGLPASTATGVVKLHTRFGSPVVPMVVLRCPDRIHHRIIIREILSDLTDKDGNPFGKDMVKSLQMCNNTLEAWIRSHPDQWMWLQDRWKSTVPL